MAFGTVDQAIADIKAGKLIIVADDEDREQNDRQLERSEKPEDPVALPAWAGSGGRCGHCGERAFSARSETGSTREFASLLLLDYEEKNA